MATLGIADTFTPVDFAPVVTFVDLAAIAESLTLTDFTPVVTFVDMLGIFGQSIALTDSIQLSVGIYPVIALAVADALTITDAVRAGYGVVIRDALTATDALASLRNNPTFIALNFTFAESLSLTDNADTLHRTAGRIGYRIEHSNLLGTLYAEDETLSLHATFYAFSGILADPPDVTAHLISPLGVQHTYTFGVDSELTRLATGSYKCNVPLSGSGLWAYQWLALNLTGVAGLTQFGSATGVVEVAESEFIQ